MPVFPLIGSSFEKATVTTPFMGQQSNTGGYHVGGAHKGVDLAARMGDPVAAAVDGRVIVAGWDTTGYGNTVVIEDAKGNTYRVAHLSEINVKPGQTVAAGVPIGKVGSTGNSTGPHLHFEVHGPGTDSSPFGQLIDPTPLLKGANMADGTAPPPADQARNSHTIDAYTQVVAYQRSRMDNAEAQIKQLYQQLQNLDPGDPRTGTAKKVIEDQIKAAQQELYDARNDWSKATADLGVAQDKGPTDALALKVAQFNLQKAQHDYELATDPQQKRLLEMEVKKAEAQVNQITASIELDRQRLGLDVARVGAENALTGAQAGRINALLPSEIRQAAAQAGLTEAQASRLEALLGPEREQMEAGTAYQRAQTDRLTALTPLEIEQAAAQAGLTAAQTERLKTLLPLEADQMGAGTEYQRAQTGRLNALLQPELDQMAAQTAYQNAQTAKLAHDQAVAKRAQAISDLVASGQMAIPDAMRALGQFSELFTAQLQQQNADRTRAQNALDSYAQTGLATAPFVQNVVSATAPVQGLHAAAQAFGLDPSSPIVRGVQDALSRAQQQTGLPSAGSLDLPGAPAPALPKPPDPGKYTFNDSDFMPARPAYQAPAPAARPAASPAASAPTVPPAFTEVADDLGNGMAQNFTVDAQGNRKPNGDPYAIGGGGVSGGKAMAPVSFKPRVSLFHPAKGFKALGTRTPAAFLTR